MQNMTKAARLIFYRKIFQTSPIPRQDINNFLEIEYPHNEGRT